MNFNLIKFSLRHFRSQGPQNECSPFTLDSGWTSNLWTMRGSPCRPILRHQCQLCLQTCAAKINDFVIVGDHVDSVQHFSIPAWSSAVLNGIFMWKRRFKIRKSHWKILNFMFYQSRFHILLDLKRSVQFWCLKVGRFKIGNILESSPPHSGRGKATLKPLMKDDNLEYMALKTKSVARKMCRCQRGLVCMEKGQSVKQILWLSWLSVK